MIILYYDNIVSPALQFDTGMLHLIMHASLTPLKFIVMVLIPLIIVFLFIY